MHKAYSSITSRRTNTCTWLAKVFSLCLSRRPVGLLRLPDALLPVDVAAGEGWIEMTEKTTSEFLAKRSMAPLASTVEGSSEGAWMKQPGCATALEQLCSSMLTELAATGPPSKKPEAFAECWASCFKALSCS